MKDLLNQIRLALGEKLILLGFQLMPKDHSDSVAWACGIRAATAVLATRAFNASLPSSPERRQEGN